MGHASGLPPDVAYGKLCNAFAQLPLHRQAMILEPPHWGLWLCYAMRCTLLTLEPGRLESRPRPALVIPCMSRTKVMLWQRLHRMFGRGLYSNWWMIGVISIHCTLFRCRANYPFCNSSGILSIRRVPLRTKILFLFRPKSFCSCQRLQRACKRTKLSAVCTAFHLSNSLWSGHYRAALSAGHFDMVGRRSTWLVSDDGRPAVPATSADMHTIQRNCYIIGLHLLADNSG